MALGQLRKTLEKINATRKVAHIETELKFGLTPTLTNDAILGLNSLTKLQLGTRLTRVRWRIWCPEHLELKVCGILEV